MSRRPDLRSVNVTDYAFFALWFVLAQAFAPPDASVLTLVNERHPEQRMEWTRGDDGAWAMTLNGRELGRFRRANGAVVHETGQRPPDVHRLSDLVEIDDLRPGATRVRARGQFAPALLHATHEGPTVTFRDPSRQLTIVGLRLQSASAARR